ncbi:hypothetical protein F53441_12605 [Fusarium austroafricanum]|uniref:non-specific serine/threonine protein kinase n=1 Tax=Fusarium austroafricanum TaxID=2364996 RepID=A0A8H4JWN4_9HYPO|nr:hypothetical protein F53441_12605 [Fusarium austroafricanum]
MADISDSPPPTPTRSSYRFKIRGTPCEFPDEYYPGGLHPVDLDDVFNDGQYKVIRKLGNGSFSTVWLAHDLKGSRYVALKITVSDKEEQSRELQMLHYLAKVAPVESTKYITQLLGEFEHKGPNGTHKCLVLEAMGPSSCQMFLKPPGRRRVSGEKERYPAQTAKHIFRDVLKGLSFLHKNGISHGDFQPGNVLFPLKNVDSCDEATLHQPEDFKGWTTVERKDGKKDKWAPRYLYAARPLSAYSGLDGNFKIIDESLEVKLSDLGGAYFFNDPPKKPIVPFGLRAPELILKGEVHKTQDIWSFGCILFELITGRPIFYLEGPFRDEFNPDDEHLFEVIDSLGPLPDELYSHWKTASLYYTKDRKLYNRRLGGVKEGRKPVMLEPSEMLTMEEAFDKESPEMTNKEAEEIKSLIRWILQYNPDERPSADEILCHPWFAEDSSKKAE